VQLLYRQFLIVLGSFVFPLITIFAVAANLLECDQSFPSAEIACVNRRVVVVCVLQDILGQVAVGVLVQAPSASGTPDPHQIHRDVLHPHLLAESADVP
jgi:hypothetical protein